MKKPIIFPSLKVMAAAMAFTAVIVLKASAQCGAPPPVWFDEPEPIGNNFTKVQGYVGPGDKYTPPTADWEYPTVYIMPNPMPSDNSLRVRLRLNPYTALPRAECTSSDFSAAGYLVVRPCPGHYPSHTAHGPDRPFGWWLGFMGDSNTYRISAMLTAAAARWPKSIDFDAGIEVDGQSYGGAGAIYQPVLLQDVQSIWGNQVAIINARVPHTLPQHLGKTSPNIAAAWEGFDTRRLDMAARVAAGDYDNIYLKIMGSPADTSVAFDTEIFDILESGRIAYYAEWHDQGHGYFPAELTQLYAGPDQNVRLDSPLIAFSNSSQNRSGAIGHRNRGLTYDSKNVSDAAESLTVPLKYLQGDDQGPTVTFDLTVRRVQGLASGPVRWTFGSQSGTSQVTEGMLMVDGLRLDSGNDYEPLIVQPADESVTLIYSRYPSQGKWQNYETLPDIARIFGKSLEADLVLETLGTGKVETLYDCTGSDDICIAHQAAVSPDAKRAAFTVCRGTRNTNFEIMVAGEKTGMREFAYQECELWLHDFKSGENTQLTQGHIDQTPAWCGVDCLNFASNREGHYARWSWNGPAYGCYENGRNTPCKSLQIHRGRIENGTLQKIRNLTPHEMMAWGPTTMTDGDILYPSWEGDGERFGTLGGTAKYMTSQNPWWAKRMGPNGENSESEFGAHGSWPFKMRTPAVPFSGGETNSELRGTRHFIEIVPGYIMGTNYYRGNNGGSFGALFGYSDKPGEGVYILDNFEARTFNSDKIGSGRFMPGDFNVLTKWATDQDAYLVKRNADGVALGRAGYPARSTVCEYLYVNVDGWRYPVAQQDRANTDFLKTKEVAGLSIHCAKVWEITDKFDTEQTQCIAGCTEKWQVFDVQEVASYQELMGVPFPETPAYPYTDGDTARLQVVNIRDAGTLPVPGQPDYFKIRWQGKADADVSETIYGLKIVEILPWTTPPDRPGYYGLGKSHIGIAERDGSLAMDIPCMTPVAFVGINADGATVAEDLTEHSFQCGEVITCEGCHSYTGHAEELAVNKPNVEAAFRATMAGKKVYP